MKKIIMLMLAVGMTGSAYAAVWESVFMLNPDDGGYSEAYQDTLSAPTAVGSSDSRDGLFKSMLKSDTGSIDNLDDGE